MSYFNLVSSLLDLIRASREVYWKLHLSTIKDIIPWCFSYNRTNYARYLPWYLQNMKALAVTNPEVNKYLNDGRFSVQIGEKIHLEGFLWIKPLRKKKTKILRQQLRLFYLLNLIFASMVI